MKSGTITTDSAEKYRLSKGDLVLDLFHNVAEVVAPAQEDKIEIRGINPNGGYYVPRSVMQKDLKLLVVVESIQKVVNKEGTTEEALETETVLDFKYSIVENAYYGVGVSYCFGRVMTFEMNDNNRAILGNPARDKQHAKDLIDAMEQPEILALISNLEHLKNRTSGY